jgi:hypothetical protein
MKRSRDTIHKSILLSEKTLKIITALLSSFPGRMAGSYATIPDYFSSTSLPSSQKRKLDDREQSEDDRTGLIPPTRKPVIKQVASPDDWQPRQKYDQVLIGELSAGPRRVTFTVRVVNIYDRPTASKSPRAAKGCLRILAKDHSGCILVKDNILRS